MLPGLPLAGALAPVLADAPASLREAADVGASLSQVTPEWWLTFHPGADVDLTTTTDFEDLAGPAADVLEFSDQDRALLADATSATLLCGGVGGGLGLAAAALLSSRHARAR